MNVLEKIYGKHLGVYVLTERNYKQINTNENYNKEKYEAIFSDYRRTNVRKLEECFDRKIAGIPVSKQLAMIDKSKFPAFFIEDSDRLCSLFNKADLQSTNQSGSFKI